MMQTQQLQIDSLKTLIQTKDEREGLIDVQSVGRPEVLSGTKEEINQVAAMVLPVHHVVCQPVRKLDFKKCSETTVFLRF